MNETDFKIKWENLFQMSAAFRKALNTINMDKNFYDALEKILKNSSNCEVLFIILFSQWQYEEISKVYPYIVELALDGNLTSIPLARSIVHKYCQYPQAKKDTLEIVRRHLSKKDYWIYRRAAELLTVIYNIELMAELLATCKDSNDPDLFEIYEDYQIFMKPA